MNIKATPRKLYDLYDDYENMEDKFGLMGQKEHRQRKNKK